MASATCCAHLLWLMQKLSDYGVHITHASIFCDNTSAVSVTKDHIMFSHTKQMEIRYYFLH